MLNKSVNFNKNETESRLENPTYSFRETNLVLQRNKSKTVMSWSSRKKKEDNFCTVYFVRKEFFFNICVLSQCIVYRIPFQIYIRLHIKKHYFVNFCCLFLKLLKAFSVSLRKTYFFPQTIFFLRKKTFFCLMKFHSTKTKLFCKKTQIILEKS